METNNVEMVPEVMEVKTAGINGTEVLCCAALGTFLTEVVLIPVCKKVVSKIKSCKKPELQAVEDEE